MQTGQRETIEEHLWHCGGKLEGKDVDVGTITARNYEVFPEMFFVFLQPCIIELPLLAPLITTHTDASLPLAFFSAHKESSYADIHVSVRLNLCPLCECGHIILYIYFVK